MISPSGPIPEGIVCVRGTAVPQTSVPRPSIASSVRSRAATLSLPHLIPPFSSQSAICPANIWRPAPTYFLLQPTLWATSPRGADGPRGLFIVGGRGCGSQAGMCWPIGKPSSISVTLREPPSSHLPCTTIDVGRTARHSDHRRRNVPSATGDLQYLIGTFLSHRELRTSSPSTWLRRRGSP